MKKHFPAKYKRISPRVHNVLNNDNLGASKLENVVLNDLESKDLNRMFSWCKKNIKYIKNKKAYTEVEVKKTRDAYSLIDNFAQNYKPTSRSEKSKLLELSKTRQYILNYLDWVPGNIWSS